MTSPVRRVHALAPLSGWAQGPLLLTLAWTGTACGGGAALMHPAHTLPAETVTAGAGVSQQFVLGEAGTAVETSPTIERERQVLRGAVAEALTRPGIAPWVGARAGVGGRCDAGLTYSGRTVRVDGRHAFEKENLALSLGIGGTSVLSQLRKDDEADGVDTRGLWGWGLDLPIVAGYRSSASVIQTWIGARLGYESLGGFVAISERLFEDAPPGQTPEAELDADRFHAGGLVGLMVGVEPIWVGIELDVAYQWARGRLGSTTTTVVSRDEEGREQAREERLPQYSGLETGWFTGPTLAPTGALLVRFE